jgi:hypothetical protein
MASRVEPDEFVVAAIAVPAERLIANVSVAMSNEKSERLRIIWVLLYG